MGDAECTTCGETFLTMTGILGEFAYDQCWTCRQAAKLPVVDMDARDAADALLWKDEPDDFICACCGVAGYVQCKTVESACGGFDDYFFRCGACGQNWKSEGPDA